MQASYRHPRNGTGIAADASRLFARVGSDTTPELAALAAQAKELRDAPRYTVGDLAQWRAAVDQACTQLHDARPETKQRLAEMRRRTQDLMQRLQDFSEKAVNVVGEAAARLGANHPNTVIADSARLLADMHSTQDLGRSGKE